jgi:flagella basal body P-ring formation protein FlgA
VTIEASFAGAEAAHVALSDVVQASSALAASEPERDLASASPMTDSMLENELQAICSESLGLELTDVEVHLSQPVAAQAMRDLDAASVDFQLYPGPSLAPGGNSSIIQFWEGDQLVKTTSVRFDLIVYQPVAVLNRLVPRGIAITSDMVSVERRPVSETGFVSGMTEIEGTESLRDLPAGTLLKGNMLRAARVAQARPIVKSRDLVYVTFSSGGLNLSMADAVAMQDGQPGDVIRVMNPTSRQLFSAEVVGPGHVQVNPNR